MKDDDVSTQLARAAMAHRAAAHRLLREVGLHPGQEFLLSALADHGPQPVGQLAERLGVEQPTITKMVGRLGDLVERRSDPDDGRRTLVALTDDGWDAHDRATVAWAQLEDATTTLLDDDDAARLVALLRRVRDGLGRSGDAPAC